MELIMLVILSLVLVTVVSFLVYVVTLDVVNLGDIVPRGGSRALGLWERVINLGHDKAGCFVISNALLLRSKRPLTCPVIAQAAARLAWNNPMLHATLDRGCAQSKMRFVLYRHVVIPVHMSETTDWQNHMENQTGQVFHDQKGVLWRLWFLPNAKYKELDGEEVEEFREFPHECACIFVFHHAIIDGMSYMNLFSQFLDHVDDVMEGRTARLRPAQLKPPLYHYIRHKLTFSIADRLLVATFTLLSRVPFFTTFLMRRFGSKNKYIKKFGSVIAKDSTVEPRTRTVAFTFSKDETVRLMNSCRSNGATVQGAIQTASCLAMARMLQNDELAGDVQIPVVVAINARRTLEGQPVPDDYVGMFFTNVKWHQSIGRIHSKKEFWKIAQDTSRRIKDMIRNGDHFLFMKEMNLLAIVAERVNLENIFGEPSHRMESLLVFSNMGKCSFLERDSSCQVCLRARFGCTGEHNMGPIFFHNFVTFRGRIFFTLVYYQHVLHEEEALKYVKFMKEALSLAVD